MMDHNWLSLLIAGLAVYRLAKLITTEDGPLFVFSSWQQWIGQKAQGKNIVFRSVAFLFECPYCIGIWLAILVYYTFSTLYPLWFILAIAGLQSLMQNSERE